MNRKIWALYACIAVLTTAAVAADKGSLGVEVNGIPVTEQTAPGKDEPKTPTREACMSHCTAAESRCGSEVRRARTECSRSASTAGRNPMSGRNPTTGREVVDPMTGRADLGYFCRYFERPARQCGSDVYSRGCQARLSQRYGLCLDAMSNNIGEMRYDCYKSERDAQNFCRDELRDCKAAC